MGPTDEDPEYYQECLDLVNYLGIEGAVSFTGGVRLEDYLPEVDVIVLTSISEGQPLVILEAGSAGIPAVATDVGACRDIIEGDAREADDPLPHGGVVTPLANPGATGEAVANLLQDRGWYRRCGEAMRQRVRRHYNKRDLDALYRELYERKRYEPTRGET
jgi:glycosyltransferase involved in cell wall biosynthesis